MKVREVEGDKCFNPITIEIRFESRDELIDLRNRLNAPNYAIEKALGDYYMNTKTDCGKLFTLVDDLLG